MADLEPTCDFSKLSPDSIITYTPMENIKNGYYVPNTAALGTLSKTLTAYQENDIVMAMDRPWVNGGFKIARVDAIHLPALLIQRTACIRGKDLEQEF